ncbi:hypothetical protein ACN4EK_16265 [Pantanalinema rosaneae CENA516]|uniref:hypothetical protein n=1 Tax=Pantanalinema rosaneae TaxID=1620701 RepID=UPI003D6DF69E
MKRLKQITAIALCLFMLYEMKSALGINISERYHAIDIVRIPTKKLLRVLNSQINPPEC